MSRTLVEDMIAELWSNVLRVLLTMTPFSVSYVSQNPWMLMYAR